ncbi:hypothetical protein ZIOFF_013903 [Zingiber officinale]|uniref:Retrotransposon gag domain-containing protein n=1 Tax=Zingiber officinale TaxID=94328 RepID=A0A8J5HSH5_ZINOF|nr:hypothetical protein ZIOFF_013903 [Zingiber officinale]
MLFHGVHACLQVDHEAFLSPALDWVGFEPPLELVPCATFPSGSGINLVISLYHSTLMLVNVDIDVKQLLVSLSGGGGGAIVDTIGLAIGVDNDTSCVEGGEAPVEGREGGEGSGGVDRDVGEFGVVARARVTLLVSLFSPMAARRGRGGRGKGNMENLENDRDTEIQTLQRRVEEMTLRLEHQEARSERGSSHGYASDDSEHVNPFADRNFRNFIEKINRTTYVKVDIPEFHGRLQPEGFLDWLSAVEKFFEYKDILDGEKVKLVATRLRGYAYAWWDKTQEMRLRKGKSKIISWEKMKARLRQNFLPANFAQTIFMQFNTLQQGNKSVTDYMEEFYRLMARIDNQELEDQLAARYVNGLKATIKDEVELQ